jgi:hypothetical protein
VSGPAIACPRGSRRALGIDERRKSELQSCFGRPAGSDRRSAYPGGRGDCMAVGKTATSFWSEPARLTSRPILTTDWEFCVHKRRYFVDADPERNEWAIFSRYGLPQDCIQHRESQPGGSGDGGQQRLAPRPGSGSSATAAFVTVAAPTALGHRRLRLQPRQ